jgi:hypothetical protein
VPFTRPHSSDVESPDNQKNFIDVETATCGGEILNSEI